YASYLRNFKNLCRSPCLDGPRRIRKFGYWCPSRLVALSKLLREETINFAFSCSSWVANGFCSSTFYTAQQKRQYCGKACNLC
ncbi:unnamed protein product, partial [Angiostrongylus costaricensis]|uniref:ShKT domain-containing protein n=1 Tax=Angiostrongylus costaricensis TaxID=334426 RepID=A0A0R3PZ19_ANGCS